MSGAYLEFYRAARNEIIERVKLRDQIVLGYLAGIAALIAAAIVHQSTAILLTIPVVAIGATVIICQHQVVIRAISKYLERELIPEIHSHEEGAPTEWQCSAARDEYRAYSDVLRYGGYVALMLGPCFAAVFFFFYEVMIGSKDGNDVQLFVFWCLDDLITIAVILILFLTWKGTGRGRVVGKVTDWLQKELLALLFLGYRMDTKATFLSQANTLESHTSGNIARQLQDPVSMPNSGDENRSSGALSKTPIDPPII